MKYIAIIFLVSWSVAALAQDPAGNCRENPVEADSAAYSPGVDAQGRALAPADLYPPLLDGRDLLDGVALDLELLPVGNYLATAQQADLSESRLHLGRITLDEGRVFHNGKDISPEGERYYSTGCQGAQ